MTAMFDTDTIISESPANDDATFTYTFEMPARRDDCPKPSSRATRRLEAADGVHWFEVRGGGTQVEGAYLTWLGDQLAKAVRKAQAENDFDGEALAEARLAYNAGLATFIADRVVDHNLTDYDGDKLPLGLALFWSLPGSDANTLAARIQRRESIWSDPKAGTPLTNG